MVEIVDAKFITSAPNVASAPKSEIQDEIVFMARSNVGKSSLLNALTNHEGLAKVSSTPGKTKLINYFDVTFINRDDSSKSIAKFVDLPGFGYAKVSKAQKHDWEKNLTDYISNRKQIKLFIHLIDCRHPHLDIDTDVNDFLQSNCRESQYILQIFTKIDKLNQKEQSALRREFPHAVMVSSSKKRGMQKIIKVIYDILHDDTMKIEYRKATLGDIAHMEELVLPEVESGVILERSPDEMATNIRSYILAFYNGSLIGFCALHIHTASLAEIRSLIIGENFRGKRIGQNLVNRCIDEARDLGLQKLLSLTYKQSFFENLGFVEINKESLPEHKIWADCIKCKHFPVCNEVSLIKNL